MLVALPHAARADELPQEVTVRGARRDPGETTVRTDEVRQIPGAFGDPFRVIEAMPGTAPVASGLPYVFVRGAPPGNTGYYLDGVRVPLLFHLALGPSVIHPGLVESVDFYPGGYPAKYGRFTGGIVTADTRAPSAVARAEGHVRLYDAGGLVETPLADGRATVLAAARYSYTGLALSLASPTTRLDYWDYQARATYALTPKDTIGIFAFGSHDFLGDRDETTGVTKTVFRSQFHRVDLRWDHAIGASGRMRVAATFGIDQTSTEDLLEVRDRMAHVRVDLEQRVSPDLRVRAGADVQLDAFDLDGKEVATPLPANATQLAYPPRDEIALGVRTDLVWRVVPRVELVPGVRLDLFETHRFDHPFVFPRVFGVAFVPAPFRTAAATPAIDPRLAARVTLTDKITYVATFGVAHQRPSFLVPLAAVTPGRIEGGLQTSLQTSQGLELALPYEITASPTVFLHDYFDLTDLTASCSQIDSPSNVKNPCLDTRVQGRAFGAELLVRRSLTKRLTGWLSYTLSRSTRQANVPGTTQLATVPSEFDRTHVLSVIGSLDLGRAWRLGGRFFFYTGRPYSTTIDNVPVPPINGQRLPAFYRIDARLEKRWPLAHGGHVAAYLEGLNVTLQKEATGVTCSPTTTQAQTRDACTQDLVGPITIPSIGVEAAL